jgi:hypothetical protein
MIYFSIANDPYAFGSLHTFTTGSLEEMLGVSTVYFHLDDILYDEISKVMIRYE